MKQFLVGHNPFADIDYLRNIATGLIETEEIYCYDSLAIGIKAKKELDGTSFDKIKQSRKSKIVPFQGVNSKVQIGDKTVCIDPLLLFQRTCVMKKSDEELQAYLRFELAPFPLCLFDDVRMRKSAKSSIYTLSVETNLQSENCQYIIDVGMLL